MSLFGGNDENSSGSGLFGGSSPADPYTNQELGDSPEDLESNSKFRRVLQFSSAGLALVALIVGVIFLFGRGSSNSDLPSAASKAPDSSSSVTTSGGNADSPTNLNGYIHSVVLILVGTQEKFCASGSGFAVDDGSVIVTNDHVIESSPECKVDFIAILVTNDPSEEPEPMFVGKVLSKDPSADIALLSITDLSGNPGKLPPLQLSSEKVQVGEVLQIIGYPGTGGFTVTVTQGNIAGFTTDETGRWIKTDASISGGNSGGAAINASGKVVGVPTQAGGGGSQVVDCREFDTNNDGVINSKDSCVPIGGFLNLLRPSDYVIQAIRQVK